MTNYQFAGHLYRTQDERDAAIVYEYMTAGGLNSPAETDKAIAEGLTPEAACDEAIHEWDLLGTKTIEQWTDDGDLEEVEVPALEGLTRENLLAEFQYFFATRPDRADDEDAA